MISVEEFLMLRDLFNKGSNISEALSRTGQFYPGVDSRFEVEDSVKENGLWPQEFRL